MKFRNLKTGDICTSIESAYKIFKCPGLCADCPLNGHYDGCNNYVIRYPIEAAHEMGYEIMEEDEEHSLCDILGVHPGETFYFRDTKYQVVMTDLGCCSISEIGTNRATLARTLADMIAHPELIVRKVRLTDKELDICKSVGAKYISKDVEITDFVSLWSGEPTKNIFGCYRPDGKDIVIGRIAYQLFPSVENGELVCVEERNNA